MNENDRVSSEAPFKEDPAEQRSQTDLEWEQRTLCSDESCIGVIGPDGRCKECGKPFEDSQVPQSEPADTAETQPDTTPESAPETTADSAPEKTSEDADSQEDPAQPDSEWEQRTLCSDESCIGVIGSDGRCRECGKPYEG